MSRAVILRSIAAKAVLIVYVAVCGLVAYLLVLRPVQGYFDIVWAVITVSGALVSVAFTLGFRAWWLWIPPTLHGAIGVVIGVWGIVLVFDLVGPTQAAMQALSLLLTHVVLPFLAAYVLMTSSKRELSKRAI